MEGVAPNGRSVCSIISAAIMDANLREMGVGDLTVPKRMKSFGEAFLAHRHS